MAFLSTEAMQKNGQGRTPYTIEEDRVIVQGLENGETATTIVESLESAGHGRTVLSVRYRIGALRAASEKHDSLEALHGVPVVEPEVEPEVEAEREVTA